MCGIVGYIGRQIAYPILIEGLKKLEYRGYDSAGVALLCHEGLKVVKAKGEITVLEEKVGQSFPAGNMGIGHTRWATHGAPSDVNAHPHCACTEEFTVVHNGIIENYRALRHWLESEGHRFSSETDTEVLAHLVEHYYNGDLLKTVQEAIKKVEGSFAMVVMCRGENDKLVCARRDSPLIIGLGEGENFIASDVPAVLNYTRKIYILEDGEFAVITASSVQICSAECTMLQKEVREITWDAVAAEKGGFRHFMLKEIMEQPRALRETMRGRLLNGGREINLSELNLTPEEINDISRIYIVACGTAYHAGLVGKYAMEKLLRLPVEVDLASEFRYRDPLLDEKTMVIVISQSGETADTLAALRLARSRGNKVLAITNVVGSSVSREADKVLYTWAGPEIAVASTKAYLTQILSLYLLTLYLAQVRGLLDRQELEKAGEALFALPAKVEEILSREVEIQDIAAYLSCWESTFFIGRNMDFAVAMEGALKLKEISYIHAEAYASGELKHGTLALIVEGIPVIALATQKDIIEKSLSNIKEVKARNGYVICLAQEGTEDLQNEVDRVFYLPATEDFLTPILSVVPLQLLSYYAAVARCCPVDKPRNLAKSVTVE
ncbi:MAG: glutamine--fructose-6-phosphate transaminase (isomerizing) [Dethiobacter sp.]|jgi:glucosamine--fructose-6-phosphate aminotransferase (isomerizing)|nr:MAG: glutamine--fructose-6-phosphate transaminase (isomerizing) [Dethiobacter sp.]